ncbi:YfhO family protein [Candidatus Gottesmanbacteria bacterium]|nr:YfhO family protein [Candidatus Gottesmanbacteria bacterium]
MRRSNFIIGILFFLFPLFLFRSYITNPNLVPLPFNLLVSFYSPWKYETDLGYGLTVPNKPLGFDNLKLFYPFRKFTTQRLSTGHVPLWNPYVFSGSVHLATYQSAVFYPFNILYHLTSQADAWSVLVIIQPILIGWFTYLFLRSLSISRFGSFFGAFGFAYSGWIVAHLEEVLVVTQSILWLPLALYGSNVIRQKSKRIGFILLLMSLVMSILGGFPQMVVYLFAVTILWNIYRKTWIALVAVAASLGITAIAWVPAFEAYLTSPRATVDSSYLFETFLSPLWYLVTFLVPDFWGNPGAYNYFAPLRYLQERTIAIGISVFILALFSLSLRDRSGKTKFWKIFTLISLSLGFAIPTSWIWYIARIPLLSVAQPARIFVLSTFGLCVLSAYGFDQVGRASSSKALKKVMLTLTVVFVFLWILVIGFVIARALLPLQTMKNMNLIELIANVATISSRNLLLSTVFFVATCLIILFVKQRRNVFILLITITGLWVVYSANKILYFSDRRYEYPVISPIAKLQELASLDRVWTYGDAYITRNIPSFYHLYSPEGYEALYSHRYGKLLYTLVTRGVLTDVINRTDATLSETGQSEVMTNDQLRLRLMSLTGVKYLLEHKSKEQPDRPAAMRFPADLFGVAWEDDSWRIWEYKKVLPRAFFVTNVIVEANDQKIIDALYNPLVDLRKTVILEETPPGFAGNVANDATVSITNYEPEKVELSVETQRDGLVFLSDAYDWGWKATVDRKETKIYRANFAFRAVPIPSGSHTILFEYKPLSFQIGVWTSVGSILIVCIALIRMHEA